MRFGASPRVSSRAGRSTHSCLLLASREEALDYPRGEIALAVCEDCGFIANVAFDPTFSHYGSAYEETQAFSPRFVTFAEGLARRWVDRYDIRGKQIVEIGCGKGEFLAMMCEVGDNRGVGIDPSVKPERLAPETRARTTFLAELWSPEHRDIPADAIVCRHTLEHIAPVERFVSSVRDAVEDRRDTIVLFELPDTRRVLDQVAFWDIYYEHVSYFTPGSLARLFRRTGFDVLDLSLAYDDQYILLEARAVGRGPAAATASRRPIEEEVSDTLASVDRFEAAYAAEIEDWRARLMSYRANGRRVAIWGAGSKGVAMLTALGDTGGIDLAVDINPHKHGMYLAGSGQEIVAPERLIEDRPDVVIVMNPVYTGEIRDQLDSMGVSAELIALA